MPCVCFKCLNTTYQYFIVFFVGHTHIPHEESMQTGLIEFERSIHFTLFNKLIVRVFVKTYNTLVVANYTFTLSIPGISLSGQC